MKDKIRSFLYGATWSLFILWTSLLSTKVTFEVTEENRYLVVASLMLFALWSIVKIWSHVSSAAKVRVHQFTDLDTYFLGLASTAATFEVLTKNGSAIPSILILVVSFTYLVSRVIFLLLKPNSSDTVSANTDHFRINHDLLHNLFIKNITEVQNNYYNIGVSGSWGIGKTYFLKKVYNDLNKKHADKVIPIWIDLWGIKSSDNIVTNYLSSIEKELSRHQIIVPIGEMNDFAKHMLEKTDSFSPTTILSGIMSFKGTESPKERAANHIEKINKRIIIFLDNIERILPSDIPTVLQMVNLFGDINGVQHIISYDRIQLELSLANNIGTGDARKYIEKLVEFEISIPQLGSNFCFEALKLTIEHLTSGLDSTHKKKILRTLDDYNLNKLASQIRTPRELKRIQLHLQFQYAAVGLNTNLHDLLIITIIKVKFPVLYEKLSIEVEDLISDTRERDIRSSDQLANIVKRIGAPIEAILEIEMYFKRLLPVFSSQEIDSTLVSNRRLWHPNNYHRYFRFDELTIQFTPIEIGDLLNQLSKGTFVNFDSKLWERFNESYTPLHSNIIELDESDRNKVVSSLVNALYVRAKDQSSSEDYTNTYSFMEELLLLIPNEKRQKLLSLIIDSSDNLFWIKMKLISAFSKENSKDLANNKSSLKKSSMDLMKTNPSEISKLDYFNLHALVTTTLPESSDIIQKEMELSGTLIFNILEISAATKSMGDNPVYKFDIQHPIFSTWDHSYLLKLGTEKFNRMSTSMTKDQHAVWRDYAHAIKTIKP